MDSDKRQKIDRVGHIKVLLTRMIKTGRATKPMTCSARQLAGLWLLRWSQVNMGRTLNWRNALDRAWTGIIFDE